MKSRIDIGNLVVYRGKRYVVASIVSVRGGVRYGLAKSVSSLRVAHYAKREELEKVCRLGVRVDDIRWNDSVDASGLPLPHKFDLSVAILAGASYRETDAEIEKQVKRVYGVGYSLISYSYTNWEA